MVLNIFYICFTNVRTNDPCPLSEKANNFSADNIFLLYVHENLRDRRFSHGVLFWCLIHWIINWMQVGLIMCTDLCPLTWLLWILIVIGMTDATDISLISHQRNSFNTICFLAPQIYWNKNMQRTIYITFYLLNCRFRTQKVSHSLCYGNATVTRKVLLPLAVHIFIFKWFFDVMLCRKLFLGYLLFILFSHACLREQSDLSCHHGLCLFVCLWIFVYLWTLQLLTLDGSDFKYWHKIAPHTLNWMLQKLKTIINGKNKQIYESDVVNILVMF